MFTIINSAPAFITADDHAELTRSTPSSFADIPPVLKFKGDNVEIELDPSLDGLKGGGIPNGKSSSKKKESAGPQRIKGTLFITEAVFAFLPTGRAAKGFSLTYPYITLHAIVPASDETPTHLYCQVDDPSAGDDDDNGDFKPMRELKVFVRDQNALDDLYAAVTYCAGLHPSLEDSDDEQALPGILSEGGNADGEPSFEINMNGFPLPGGEDEVEGQEDNVAENGNANDGQEEGPLGHASTSDSLLHRLSSLFPLTNPAPTPLTHPDLIHPSSIAMEEDLVSNSENLRAWLTYINSIRDRISKASAGTAEAGAGASASPSAEDSLLGPLATQDSRRALQELTMAYERALAIFPTSFKLWKLYMLMRQSYVCGPLTANAIKAKKNNEKRGNKVKTDVVEMLAFAETEYEWEDGLDGLVGFEEWKSLITTGERMIQYLSHLPTVWLMHLSALLHPKCPSPFQRTYARRTFDRALRTLPPSLHARIWGMYLRWAEQVGGVVGDRVWRRLLKVDPSLTERHITHLLRADPPRPLPAAKYLLSLARKAAKGTYTPLEGKSPYQLFVDFLELVENFAEDVGLDAEDTEEIMAELKEREHAEQLQQAEDENKQQAESASVGGKLIRFEGAPVSVEEHAAKKNAATTTVAKVAPTEKEKYDESSDPASSKKLNVELIVKEDGLEVYKDQAGRLWTGLATYWIKRGEFDQATATFEEGITTVVTIRDFTQIFDAYSEFSETLMTSLMNAVSNPDEEDEEDLEETEAELDKRMKDFEELMDRRPFLVNDVLLRRNPNEVVEWEKRVALFGDDDEKVVDTYNRAIEAINPRKAIGPLHPLYVNFAKFYEVGGSVDPESGEPRNQPDIDAARKIFEKATRVPYKTVDELAEVWCEWAEMELRNDNYEEAIRLMQRATTIPRNTKISYHDESLSVQQRLFKSLKLWSFYVDLEESIGTVESTKAVYDKILELKIANAQVIVNYAQFLEDNKYFEESFKIYERGIELFNFPIAFELWNIYLSKFVKRYHGSKLERTRDLFEQALEKCPSKFCKPLFLMYAQLEEEYGLAKRAMGIYERAANSVQDTDKFEVSATVLPLMPWFTLLIQSALLYRCIQSTSQRLPRTLGFLPLVQSTNGRSKSFRTDRRPRCVSDSPPSNASWERSTERVRCMLMLLNSATLEHSPNSGVNGIPSRSILVPRTPSERCCGSRDPSRRLSTRRLATLWHRLPMPGNKGVRPKLPLTIRLTQWRPWRGRWEEHRTSCLQRSERQLRNRSRMSKMAPRSSIRMRSIWMMMMMRIHSKCASM